MTAKTHTDTAVAVKAVRKFLFFEEKGDFGIMAMDLDMSLYVGELGLGLGDGCCCADTRLTDSYRLPLAYETSLLKPRRF